MRPLTFKRYDIYLYIYLLHLGRDSSVGIATH
jgi:hypothetical protein